MCWKLIKSVNKGAGYGVKLPQAAIPPQLSFRVSGGPEPAGGGGQTGPRESPGPEEEAVLEDRGVQGGVSIEMRLVGAEENGRKRKVVS